MDNDEHWQGCGKLGYICCCGKCEAGRPLQRILLLPQGFKCVVTTRPNNSTCRSFSQGKGKHIHSKLVHERSQILFIIILVWKQTKCPSANEEIRTIWYEMEYNSAEKGAGVIVWCVAQGPVFHLHTGDGDKVLIQVNPCSTWLHLWNKKTTRQMGQRVWYL